jgi:trigger factor
MEATENMDHVVTIEDLGGLKRKVNINFDSAGVNKAKNKACDILRGNITIKGFRKGKAPNNLISRFYIREVEKSAADLLATEGFMRACWEHKLVPMSKPEVQKVEFKIDGSFVCEIIVNQKPTINPVGYVGLQLEEPNIDFQGIFNSILEDQRQHNAEEVQKDTLELNDTAIVDYLVRSGQEEVNNGTDQRFAISAGQTEPFGENLIGMKIGEVRECTVQQQDTPLDITITLKGAVSKTNLDDDALAKKLCFQTTEEFMNFMAQQAQIEANNRRVQMLEEKVIDKLLDLNTFDVPEEWVKDEEKYILQQISITTVDEQLQGYITSMAQRNVRRTFILDSIYDAEQSLKVTSEDIESVIKAESEKRGVSTLIVKDEIKKNNMGDSIVGLIKNKKVLNYILSNAQFIAEQPAQETFDGIPENPLG